MMGYDAIERRERRLGAGSGEAQQLCGCEPETAIRSRIAREIREYASRMYPPACSAAITAEFLARRIMGATE